MRKLTLVPCLTLLVACGQTQEEKPVAAKHPVQVTLHGDVRIDNYQYLADRDHPDTQRYVKSERAWLDRQTADWRELRQELEQELNAVLPVSTTTPRVRLDGYEYWREVQPGGQYPVYYRQKGREEKQVVLDLNKLAGGSEYYNIGDFVVSPEGDMVAFTEDRTGAGDYVLKVRHLGTGEELGSTGGVLPSLAWLHDDAVTYIDSALNAVMHYNTTIRQRRQLQYEVRPYGHYSMRLSRDRNHIVLTGRTPVSTEITLIDRNNKGWQVSPHRDGHLYQVRVMGDRLYLLSNFHVENYELAFSEMDDLQNWTRHSFPGEHILDFEAFDSGVVILTRQGLTNSIYLVDPAGEYRILRESKTGEEIRLASNPDPSQPHVRVELTSLARPSRMIDINLETGLSTRVATDQYETRIKAVVEELWYAAEDGTRVPISFLSAEDNPQPGPVLVTAYGAYGIPQARVYRPSYQVLLNRGFAIAQVHVRGGGELGPSWHESGRRENKHRGVTDFIDGLRFLRDKGYVDRARVIARGVSAGAVIVAEAMNRQPDMFAGVILYSPYLDVVTTLLDGEQALTSSDHAEFGNPGVSEDYESIRLYSPYEQIRIQDYPPVLVTVAANDNRVAAHESLKWLAKIRQHDTGDALKLLNLREGGGHFGTTDQYEKRRQDSLEFAFMLTRQSAAVSPALNLTR